MNRLAIAAVVGGVVVFIWSSFSHLALPTGGQGLLNLPNEDAVLYKISYLISKYTSKRLT